jgi:monolysocardiolipin acyltransferase
MGLTGSLSRGFLYGLNYIEVIGLDRFLETLDKRNDITQRERGLITGTELCLNDWATADCSAFV